MGWKSVFIVPLPHYSYRIKQIGGNIKGLSEKRGVIHQSLHPNPKLSNVSIHCTTHTETQRGGVTPPIPKPCQAARLSFSPTTFLRLYLSSLYAQFCVDSWPDHTHWRGLLVMSSDHIFMLQSPAVRKFFGNRGFLCRALTVPWWALYLFSTTSFPSFAFLEQHSTVPRVEPNIYLKRRHTSN